VVIQQTASNIVEVSKPHILFALNGVI